MTWNITVIVVCLILAAVSVWQEFTRPNRARLPLRLLAVIVAMVALICLILPINYQSKIVVNNKEGVLLTEGFSPDSLTQYAQNQLFTNETEIQQANHKYKIELVSDLADFVNHRYHIPNKLHILGYGLNGDELKQLNGIALHFHPTVLRAGITAVNWNRKLKAGEALQIQGRFLNAPVKTTIVLKGLNTTLDSVTIQSKSGSNFSLKTIPKNTGRSTYSLLALNGKDTLENETIPFEVEPARPLKVLMLATSPDFENRFLKNWLAQQGYVVAVRTTISKEKFSREYFNMPQTPVDRLTNSLLQKFDLLIGDLSAFQSLSNAENGVLQQQMSNGLGCIVKADSNGKGATFLANAFPMDRLAGNNQKASALIINGQSTPSLPLSLYPVFIKSQPNTQPLILDTQNRTIASSTIYGSGKIVFSTLTNTFNWSLSGDLNDYTALWSMLISKAARKIQASQTWSVLPALPIVKSPVMLIVKGPSALPIQVKVEQNAVAFRQNPTVPFSWDATFWPRADGWQQVSQNNVAVYWWYAFNPAGWAMLHANEHLLATQKYISRQQTNVASAPPAEQDVRVPVSQIYIYILLLLSCTYLWVERKL